MFSFKLYILQISVVPMIQTKKGRYVRQNTPCVEMDVSKDTSYHTFCLLAADKLKLEGVRSKELEPCLFKMNGSMVLDDDITLKECNKPWTIGRYLLRNQLRMSNLVLALLKT